ncbi:MAG: tryptophan--tRNA ligase [Alphaproteobacteria bacterium]|nr:tryptophan--tRNA ligase [Alphaproteobacteria bacterium]
MDQVARQDVPYEGPERVLSGMQATGNLHLGNYLGALKRFVPLADEFETLYCIVDLHAITEWQEPRTLAANTRAVAAAYIAAGLDPERSIIFNQSQVPAHAELAWILSCVARIGWMNRMTQFKDKAGKDREKASLGLYNYPVLMAADILAYKATRVPVGEDQKQHLELARDIAQKFMNDYDVPGFFPLPEPLIGEQAARVMSLRDGTRKMSKSDASDMTRINLSDSDEDIAQKLKKARTDPEPVPSAAEELGRRPEAANLLAIHAALGDETIEAVMARHGGETFSAFKEAMTARAISVLAPIRERMKDLLADVPALDATLGEGAERARAIAAPTLAEAKRIVGFVG